MPARPNPLPFRVIGDPDSATGPFVFTCEHASNRPVGVVVSASDRALLDDHWGYDVGIAPVVEHLARGLDCPAVLSTVSRLVIDANRPLDSQTLIVERCGGVPVSFNQGLSQRDRRERVLRFHSPYHGAIDGVVTARLSRGPAHLVSMHSFTPEHLGQRRSMEVGVLFDEAHEAEGQALGVALRGEGFVVALNEPYTGKGGELTYSVMTHGRAWGTRYIELEVRNDLLRTADGQADVAARIGRALAVFAPG